MNTQSITPKYSTKFEVGAILVDSWGSEQTNVDFYVIVKRVNNSLYLLPMNKLSSKELGFMTNEVSPSLVDYSAKPIRKLLKSFEGVESGFTFRNYTGGGWCRLWKGAPVTETHYA